MSLRYSLTCNRCQTEFQPRHPSPDAAREHAREWGWSRQPGTDGDLCRLCSPEAAGPAVVAEVDPEELKEALSGTYSEDGIRIWWNAWNAANSDRRKLMELSIIVSYRGVM